MPHAEKTCTLCGKKYQAYCSATRPLSRSKFCSRVCATTFLARKQTERATITRTCPICGTEFQTTLHHGGRKTCSYECAYKLRGSNAAKTSHEKNSVDLICDNCGKEFNQPKCRVLKHNFCSRECNSAYQHKQGSTELMCEQCGKPYWTSNAQIRLRESRFCSKKCKNDWTSKNYRGENNPNWNGGCIVHWYGRNWRRQREKAIKRDNATCQACGYVMGSGDTRFEVHHIKRFIEFDGDWKKANRLTNLICLCKDCHAAVESGKIECPLPKS